MNKKNKQEKYIKVDRELAGRILRAMEREYEELDTFMQSRLEDLATLFNFLPYSELKQLKLDKLKELSGIYRAEFFEEKNKEGEK